MKRALTNQQQIHGRICELVILLALLPCFACGEEAPLATISVSGQAEMRVVPDQIKLQFGVESRAKLLTDAVNDNDRKIANAIEFLRTLDITERNVRTELISIRPIYLQNQRSKAQQQANDPFGGGSNAAQKSDEDEPLTPTGYIVKRRLRITTNHIDRFEKVYRGLIERGMNQMDLISFTSTKLREHRDQARILAIRAAKEKAESLAGELGAKLAGVQSITEAGSYRHDQSQNVSVSDPFGGDAPGADSVAAGEIEVNATVHVIFRLRATEFK